MTFRIASFRTGPLVLILALNGLGILPGPRADDARDLSALELARRLNHAFIQVAERVSPSVVVISVIRQAEDAEADAESGRLWEWLPREFRRQFEDRFRPREPAPRNGPPVFTAQGSGLIIREDGFILTNGHVVEDAKQVRVRLQDGRQFEAEIRGVDSQSDLAVLKVDARGLPAARFADSDAVRVGEWAIAIGAPFELEYSVTFGHVSAKGRSSVIPDPTMDQDFIQTDANINPGNSGGPLVNIEGEVIGINTLIRGLRSGIGFAIPSNLACRVSDKLIEEGKFTRAWLGLEIRALRDDEDYRPLVQGISEGVVVRVIVRGGPAAKSALRPGDVITAVDGHPVATPQELRYQVQFRKVGAEVTLDVFRRGRTLQIKVQPEAWPEVSTAAVPRRAPAPPAAEAAGWGLTVKALTRDLARELGIEWTEGLVVTAVEPGSVAEARGVSVGDVLTEVNQKPVTTLQEFQEAVAGADLGQGVAIHLQREGVSRLVILKQEGGSPR